MEADTFSTIHGDPPKVSVHLPDRSEVTLNYKRWSDVQLPIDILLLTAEECEFLSFYHYIADPFRSYLPGCGYTYFGSIGKGQDVKLKVALMMCREGSNSSPGFYHAVSNVVMQVRPKAVFFLGYCYGMYQESTKLGDVVLSERLKIYSMDSKDRMILSRHTTHVSKRIAELIEYVGYGWKPPIENLHERKFEVHLGEILSGSELLQAKWQRDELVKSFPGAIAIETGRTGKFSFPLK